MRLIKLFLIIVIIIVIASVSFFVHSLITYINSKSEEVIVRDPEAIEAEEERQCPKINGVLYWLTEDGYEVIWCKQIHKIVIENTINDIPVVGISSIVSDSLLSIVIPENIRYIDDNAFKDCYNLFEVYNLSNLQISAGSTSNGYVGYYAKDIYKSLDNESKIVKDNGYYKYYDGDKVIFLGYEGEEEDLVLPNDITFIRAPELYGLKSITITSHLIPYYLKDDMTIEDAYEMDRSLDGLIMIYIMRSLSYSNGIKVYVDNFETIQSYYELAMTNCSSLSKSKQFIYISTDIEIPDDMLDLIKDGHHYRAFKGDIFEHNDKYYRQYIIKEIKD